MNVQKSSNIHLGIFKHIYIRVHTCMCVCVYTYTYAIHMYTQRPLYVHKVMNIHLETQVYADIQDLGLDFFPFEYVATYRVAKMHRIP